MISNEEFVVRALHKPFWDEKQSRATPSAFQRADVSISRLSILPYGNLLDIFHHDLDDVPSPERLDPRRVNATAILTVADIHKACPFDENAKQHVQVVPAPQEASEGFLANPAHAEIRRRQADSPAIPMDLTRGMANAILKFCEYGTAFEPYQLLSGGQIPDSPPISISTNISKPDAPQR
jgi:hypothetical protein